MVQEFTDTQAYVSSPESYNKANIFLGLIEYELNSICVNSY